MKLSLENRQANASSSPRFQGWAVLLVLLITGTLLRASELPPPYTVNLPFQANEATPVWLGHPETPQRVFATLNLPIEPPDPSASLLVTVFFQEKEGGFLRISWQGPQDAQTLSNNFYEGIAMNNQRSLLVSPETMQGAGTLSFQGDDSTLSIQRIKLEWLETHDGLVSQQVRDLLVTPAVGATQPSEALSGQPTTTDPAAWHGQVVTVPITDLPERIEQGVEYSVQMDNVPALARLALKEAGLPLGRHIVVWINRKRAALVTPAVPDLLDDGFFLQANTPTAYVGWRDGSIFVPVASLKAGTNAVQFSEEDDVPEEGASTGNPSTGPVAPLAVKNVVLQLCYPSAPVQPAPPTRQADSTPSTSPATSPAPATAPADSPMPSLLLSAPTLSTSTDTNTTNTP